MEHRLHPRNNDHFDVILSNPRYGKVNAQVHDISQEGIAVHLDKAPFPTGTFVEVAVPVAQRQRFRKRNLKGYVIHVEDGEVGLWLLEPNEWL
jgi:hypothetical protein